MINIISDYDDCHNKTKIPELTLYHAFKEKAQEIEVYGYNFSI